MYNHEDIQAPQNVVWVIHNGVLIRNELQSRTHPLFQYIHSNIIKREENELVNFNFKTKHATPEWLTSVLTRNGFLSNGKYEDPDFMAFLQKEYNWTSAAVF